MIKRQLELEENAIDTAVQKYQQMKSEVEKIGQGVALRPAQMLLAEWFDPLTEAIREEQLNIKYFIFIIHNGNRQNKGAISEKSIQPYMLVLKPDKIAIIVLHELTHILMQSPAGNAYTYCCENVGRIIKVYFFSFFILFIVRINSKSRK